jgi:hypothetical protein
MIMHVLFVDEGLNDEEIFSGGMHLHRMRENRSCVCGNSEGRQKEGWG